MALKFEIAIMAGPIVGILHIVIWAQYVVLPQSLIALEVDIAIVAGPMRVGTLHVLLEGTEVHKPSFTAVTVSHNCGSPIAKGV